MSLGRGDTYNIEHLESCCSQEVYGAQNGLIHIKRQLEPDLRGVEIQQGNLRKLNLVWKLCLLCYSHGENTISKSHCDTIAMILLLLHQIYSQIVIIY